VLLLRVKAILVDGRPVKLYSLDGRTWFSRPHDMTEFKRRRHAVKSTIQGAFSSFLKV